MDSPAKRERPRSNLEREDNPASPRSSRAKLTRPPTPGTPPSPLVAAVDSLPLESDYTANATAKQAHIQMERLLATPLPQAHAFARLSSQHSLSDYNALKLRQLAPAPAPAAPASLAPPLPVPPRPLLVRSQSATIPTSIAKNIHDRVGNSWTMFKSTSQAAVDLIPRRVPTPDNIPRSLPHPVRPSTPPTLTIPPSVPSRSTALTPTLLNFSLAPLPTTSPATSPTKSTNSTDLRSAISDALSTKLARVPLFSRAVLTRSRSGNTVIPPTAPTATIPATDPRVGTIIGGQMMLPGMEVMNGNAVKTSASHPMNISPIIPPEWIPCIAASQQSIDPTENHSDSTAPWMVTPSPAFDLYRYVTTTEPPPPPPQAVTRPIGNFFLSSCPGKKVRLTGVQVKGGRSAICRDLISDFKRAKEFGVSLLVCCLDDEELAFLGAPWEEYQLAAGSLELDIIRIPIAEGYAPNSTALLDELLSRIIVDYILQGKSVLCSCRGGVGRAGGIALCFLLKFGLLGDLRLVSSAGGEERAVPSEDDQQFEIVKRSIEVIRRRRSMKAIETPQQVQFILDYVRFLQSSANSVPISSLLPTS